MQAKNVARHVVSWLDDYCSKVGTAGFIIGISGGVDSALTSILCAMTGRKVILLSMPIRQTQAEYSRANNHINDLETRFSNVSSYDINLTDTFTSFEKNMPFDLKEQHLAMANSRSRLRMTTLYAIGQANSCLVAGTGNKVEDFGIGFYTKYGDGGVDLSPIADLMKSEVYKVGAYLKVPESILVAKPTDGLFGDSRTDEDQIGASYDELEWAMLMAGQGKTVADFEGRTKRVMEIYTQRHKANKHKMDPIPVCEIPEELMN